jgi:hypothetical protein
MSVRLAHFRIELDTPLPAPGVVRMTHSETGKVYWRQADGRTLRELMEDDAWNEGEPPVGVA